ncbi:MAG: tetratricopeptide repeat protein [Bacteroidetes bacterium]|nr:tetratricopeptide repeat protein [Bacteroidota bacterium]
MFLLADGNVRAQEENFNAMLDSARSLLEADPKAAVVLSTRAAAAAGNDVRHAMAEEIVAEAYHRAGKNSEALRTFDRVATLAQRLRDLQLLARVYNGRGVVLVHMNRYDQALEAHLRAVALFDSLGNDMGKAQALHDMAQALLALGDDAEARETHQQALRLRLQEDHRQGVAQSYNSLGDIHRKHGKLDSALVLYEQALAQQKPLGLLTKPVAESLNDIGDVYCALKQFSRALEYYREALTVSEQVGNRNLVTLIHKNLGMCHARLREFPEAREYLLKARDMARSAQLGSVLGEVLQELSLCFEQLGNHREALNAYRESVRVRDSLRTLISPRRMEQAGDLFTRQKQDQVRKDYEHTRSQDLIIFILIVAILLGAVALIALSLLRVKARTNRTLAMKNEEIREMNLQLNDLNQELARSEEKYRLLFERLPVGVFLYDSELTLLHFNDAFVEILGSTRKKLEGLDMRLLKDRRILPALQSALEGEVGSYEGQYATTTVDREIDVAMRTAPLSYGPDIAPYGIGFVLDITNWKSIERELLEAKEIAEQADSLKHAFLTNISHEIRTPLNIIMGYFGLLQTDLRDRLNADETDHFEKVDLAVRRLLRTVDQILNLSILESGSYALTTEQCVLNELAHEVVEELRPLAQEKNLTLSLRSPARDLIVTVDRYSVAQALRNTLDNAIKFTDSGEITVSFSAQEKDVTIVVEDSGIGMTDQYIQRLYQSFSQEKDGYTRPYDGLGLGLTLTKRYIEVNGGSINVRSRKGVGTVFTLELPLTHQAVAVVDEAIAPPPVDNGGPPPSILAVEDDHETQKFLALILHGSCDMKFAESAEEAWELLQRESFHLILMDISLRGEEDGLQLTRRIRAEGRNPGIPIVAVTAHAFADDRRRSLEAGCNEYLPKPFRVKELKELVARFVAYSA